LKFLIICLLPPTSAITALITQRDKATEGYIFTKLFGIFFQIALIKKSMEETQMKPRQNCSKIQSCEWILPCKWKD